MKPFAGTDLFVKGALIPSDTFWSFSAVVKVVVALSLIIQAALRVVRDSFFGVVVGLRCTSLIRLQLRVAPDLRLGLALRAAA